MLTWCNVLDILYYINNKPLEAFYIVSTAAAVSVAAAFVFSLVLFNLIDEEIESISEMKCEKKTIW